jgi:hypothetical protein
MTSMRTTGDQWNVREHPFEDYDEWFHGDEEECDADTEHDDSVFCQGDSFMFMNDQAYEPIWTGDHSLGHAGKPSSEKILSPPGGCPLLRVNLNAHSGKSKWQDLVDRGANGGIVGNICQIITRTGKHIDLCGVDDHTVSNLKLVTAGAVVMPQKGPIIIVANQCARMANGKTIFRWNTTRS